MTGQRNTAEVWRTIDVKITAVSHLQELLGHGNPCHEVPNRVFVLILIPKEDKNSLCVVGEYG